MSNDQIIAEQAVLQGIFTREQVEEFQNNGIPLPLHTAEYWKSKGYAPRKDALEYQIVIWKRKDGARGGTDEFYKKIATFYKGSDVERL